MLRLCIKILIHKNMNVQDKMSGSITQDTMKGEILKHFVVFLPWANNSVATPKMVACPKLASQKWNGAETKHILKH